MKRNLMALFMIICFTTLNATTLLKTNMADPDAITVGDWVYFAGTDHLEHVRIYTFHTSHLTSNSNIEPHVSLVDTYKPSEKVNDGNKYCGVAGPDLAQLPNGLFIMTFVATLKSDPNDDFNCHQILQQGISPTSFYTLSDSSGTFGPPLFVNQPLVNVASTTSTHPSTFSHNSVRIDPSIFVDPDDNSIWFSYTWFLHEDFNDNIRGNGHFGNANATINVNENILFDNNFPNHTYDENINEAPEIFKRNNKYYLIYSENFFTSKYQAYYKIASSVQGLSRSAPSCRLTFNSWETKPNPNSSGYNAGHAGVFKVGSEYYLIYHIGNGSAATGSYVRSTYIDRLEFYPSGNIKQIAAPSFVGGGPHTGTFGHCH